MSKFVLKFLLLFTTVIFLMFFSLVMYNRGAGPKRNITRYDNTYENIQTNNKMRHKAPAPIIPIVIIIAVSSIFTYVVFRYIEKNYVLPLADIQDKINVSGQCICTVICQAGI